MGYNTQGRKWALVINNPQEAGLDHKAIIDLLKLFSPAYYCLCDEIATTGTYHTHVFFYAPSPVRFGTLRKEGHWTGSEKAETSVPGTFEEWGEIPSENSEKNPEMSHLIDNIQAGMTTAEIVLDNPSMAFKVNEIDELRQVLLTEKYTPKFRQVEVSYLYGASGTGKTRGIFAKHPAEDICRVTNYRATKGISFDSYHGQQVLVFEEFDSQIPIEEMLNYLDVYPLHLPARYSDRMACYTTVYITSNLPLEEQYRSAQEYKPETWRAFLRRIHHVVEYLPDGSTVIHKAVKNPYGSET